MAYTETDLRIGLDQLVLTISPNIQVVGLAQGHKFIEDVDIQKPYFDQIEDDEDDDWFKFVGCYIPSMAPRATIAIRSSLSPRAWYLALLHELTHVVLHRPASDDYDEDGYRREEPCAHTAAASICLRSGINDYGEVMISVGVPAEWLHTDDTLTVEQMTESVWNAVQTPQTLPPWATPI